MDHAGAVPLSGLAFEVSAERRKLAGCGNAHHSRALTMTVKEATRAPRVVRLIFTSPKTIATTASTVSACTARRTGTTSSHVPRRDDAS